LASIIISCGDDIASQLLSAGLLSSTPKVTAISTIGAISACIGRFERIHFKLFLAGIYLWQLIALKGAHRRPEITQIRCLESAF
jgi:hypothetical protein